MTDIVKYTPVDQIPALVAEVRKSFRTLKTHSNDYRKEQLRNLYRLVDENLTQIAAAVHKDLRKSKHELEIFESAIVTTEIVEMIAHLDAWTAPEKPSVALVNAMDGCQLRRDPLGVVLIIGAWNYPIQLTLLPMVAAIAAGNAVIVKPSEVSPHTAQLLADLFPKYLDKDIFRVVNGGVAETTKLLEQRFDFILYTGNSAVGKIIMSAAAKHLTPVCLELGGKSPVVILDDADPVIAGRRIAWGRFVNAGQTCIAPDYILCSPSMQKKLVPQLQAAIKEYFGADPQKSDSYCRIVNANHFKRVSGLIEQDKVAIGGQTDQSDLYVAPTVLTGITADSPSMQQEIFGPILPILNVNNVDEAIDFINDREKPLALYVFGAAAAQVKKVVSSTSSGSVVANDTLVQASVPALPFGGVGNSGTRGYHGKHGFDLFTHLKSTMLKDQNLEAVNSIRYPPYTDKKTGIVKGLLHRTLDGSSIPIIAGIGILGAAVAATAYAL